MEDGPLETSKKELSYASQRRSDIVVQDNHSAHKKTVSSQFNCFLKSH